MVLSDTPVVRWPSSAEDYLHPHYSKTESGRCCYLVAKVFCAHFDICRRGKGRCVIAPGGGRAKVMPVKCC